MARDRCSSSCSLPWSLPTSAATARVSEHGPGACGGGRVGVPGASEGPDQSTAVLKHCETSMAWTPWAWA